MSPKILSLAAGLTALGMSLSATRTVADEPAPPAPSPAPSQPKAPSPTVLLMSNGQVFRGPIVEDGDWYIVRHRFGEIRKKRREVEGCFDTIEAAFEHKRAHTPARDPGERLRLARWCMDQKLFAQAKEQLEELVKLDPEDAQAKAMLFSVAAVADHAAARDPMVLQTAGQADRDPNEPGPLDLAPIRAAGRRRGPAQGPPVILDLPPALAVRRYQEFGRTVHVELQRRCARCHNEQARVGHFQLVQARTPRDFADELLVRTNLDAALSLVNPQDLADSRLLTLAFKPHGKNRMPLFTGPNDPAFRVLAAWVNSLQTPDQAPSAAAARVGFAPQPAPAAPGSGGFATSRPTAPPAPGAATPGMPPLPQPTPPPVVRGGTPPGRMIPGSAAGYPTEPPTDDNFQTTSPLINGTFAAPTPTRAAPRPPAPRPGPAAAAPKPDGLTPVVDANGQPVLGPDGQPLYEAPKTPRADRKPKNFNLDPALMQSVIARPR
jgi:hypothetical protein